MTMSTEDTAVPVTSSIVEDYPWGNELVKSTLFNCSLWELSECLLLFFVISFSRFIWKDSTEEEMLAGKWRITAALESTEISASECKLLPL